jgi:hypothetical protein
MDTSQSACVFGVALLVSLSVPAKPTIAEPTHAVDQSEVAGPDTLGSREVCTTISWGEGNFRTECRVDSGGTNPALQGICTTYYGHRVCH